ncbi:hypothetical protein SAMD00019534_126660, partial [Acytostelium subglobosum LB1]|uniref:hypothetical protein n=1 Tax=Acytostelium subglobosum LB1 TaxID=1410327 RepID=UPI0006451971
MARLLSDEVYYNDMLELAYRLATMACANMMPKPSPDTLIDLFKGQGSATIPDKDWNEYMSKLGITSSQLPTFEQFANLASGVTKQPEEIKDRDYKLSNIKKRLIERRDEFVKSLKVIPTKDGKGAYFDLGEVVHRLALREYGTSSTSSNTSNTSTTDPPPTTSSTLPPPAIP